MSSLVFWPAALGPTLLAVGLYTHRQELFAATARDSWRLLAVGPIFIAAALATFSGEHFTQARGFSRMVPPWLPLRVPIVYLVGACLLAAALSLAARRYLHWSARLLALLFALFVLLIYLPAALTHARTRILWIFPFREGTFALGAFSVFAYEAWPTPSRRFALSARLFTAIVLIFFGLQNLLHPEFAPGVPNMKPTAAWVPLPGVLGYLTGVVLLALGAATLRKKGAVTAIISAGILMTALTVALYVPDLFLAHSIPADISAINFVADTLLFAGCMFVVARAVRAAGSGAN